MSNEPNQFSERSMMSGPHPCSYFPGRTADTRFFYQSNLADWQYEALLSEGWRRSGCAIYKPECDKCKLCIQIRVPTDLFVPSASQKRAIAKNQDLVIAIEGNIALDEAIELYGRYQIGWHGKTEMPDEEDTRMFLGVSPLDTALMTYRVDNRLIGVGWIDILSNGLSSVYFAFDPLEAKRSLGVFSLCMEIEFARRMGKKWLYLGYWIPGCSTMSYKANYTPYEILIDGSWLSENSAPSADTLIAHNPGTVIDPTTHSIS